MGFYWLHLFGFILLMVLAGLFTRFAGRATTQRLGPSLCDGAHGRDHAYVCGKKVSIHGASITAWARLPGISLNTARAIRMYVREHPDATIDDLRGQHRIGAKTVAMIREHFY